jgi:hypothetical protein
MWREKLYDAIEPLDPYLDDRVLVVSTVYLASLLILDVTPWKACVIVAVVYGFLILKIGQRSIHGVCAVLFAVAMVRWTDIAGINELAAQHWLRLAAH